MSESESFWRSVLDDLDSEELPASLDPSGIAGDTPEWVTSMTAEVMNMIMPRLQLRIGDCPTPEKVGALVGNHLALCEEMGGLTSNAKYSAALGWAQPLLGGFDGVGALAEMMKQRSARRDLLAKLFVSVLERPANERHRFFRAFTRGIEPEKQSEDLREGAEYEKKRMNTLAVYGVVITNWQKFDVLNTSREAYDLLVKMLPVEIVGHDRERVRRMFERHEKVFGPPGKRPEEP